MTLLISTRKMLRQEIRRHSWMFGLTFLLHLLTGPVVFLLYISSYDTWTTANTLNRFHDFFRELYMPWQLFSMIVCITMCIAIYRFLFDRRMVDLYHSVPMRRGQLFLVKYIHGLLVWLLPFLTGFVFILLLCCLRLFGNPALPAVTSTMLKAFCLLLVCYFIFYHLFLVAVYLSGNVINMFTNVALIGLCPLGLWCLFFAFAGYFLDTYCYTPPVSVTDLICSLSPFAAPFGIYSYFAGGTLFTRHLLLLGFSILFSVLMLLLARYLYRIRPSELAEHGTPFQCYTIPAHMLATIVLGLAGSLFFSNISDSRGTFLWGMFGAILCSILGAGFLNSIFYANIKAFFCNKIQFIAATLLSVFFVLSMQLDLFGYDTYLPDKEDIVGIAVYTHALSDNSTTYICMENGNLIREDDTAPYVVQKEFFTDTELCYDLLSTFIYADTDMPGSNTTGFYTKVMLKNGRTYTRYYRLYDTMSEKIAPFIEDDSYKKANYKLSTGALGYPDKMTFSLWEYSISGKLETDMIQRLMDAYRLDFEEHYTLRELSSYLYVGELNATYNYSDGVSTRNFSLRIHDNYTRTLEVLRELLPQNLPAVNSPDDIREIVLYAPEMTTANKASLYQYFGYKTANLQAGDIQASDIEAEVSESYRAEPYLPDGPTAEMISYDTVSPESTSSKELSLPDRDAIEELYPLLYFGNYRDLFGRNEYIYTGHMITTNGYLINIYTKPGTLPVEYVEQMYEVRQ